jgi:F420-0:gamma-glutamyl ligase-like protein
MVLSLGDTDLQLNFKINFSQESLMFEFMSSLGVVGFLFGFLMVVLWTLLPFAVFGIKDRLDKQIELLTAINEQLKRNQSQ